MAMHSSRVAGLPEDGDVGGSALARVPVVPPLPLLVARLEAPGLRVETPAKAEGVRVKLWPMQSTRTVACCHLVTQQKGGIHA